MCCACCWRRLGRVEIDSGTPADEVGLVAVVQKLIKQRQESAAQYEQAGRDELATREREEITVLMPFFAAAG